MAAYRPVCASLVRLVLCLLHVFILLVIAPLKVMILASCVVAGMSTCPEVIVARHGQRPMRCLGLSLITNHCAMDYECQSAVNHDNVLDVADQRAADLQCFVSTLIARVSLD